MRTISAVVIIISLFGFTIIESLSADSYRCGRKLIRTGDSRRDLVRVCGEPGYKDRGYAKIKIEGALQKTRVERWYYRKSKRSLERVVLIYRGVVAGIKVGTPD